MPLCSEIACRIRAKSPAENPEIRTDRRDEHEALGTGGPRRPGEGDDITEVDAPERGSAARSLDGGAERTEGVLDRLAKPRHGRLDRIETGDQRSQLRTLDAERLAADRDNPLVSRISEESLQQMPSNKSGCTGEESGAAR